MEAQSLADRLALIGEVVQVLAQHASDVLLAQVLPQLALLVHGFSVDVLLDTLDVLRGLANVFDEVRSG